MARKKSVQLTEEMILVFCCLVFETQLPFQITEYCREAKEGENV